MDSGHDRGQLIASTTVEGDLGQRFGPVQMVALGPDESMVACDLPAEGSITIGRGGQSTVELADRRVSRQHARLLVGPGPSFAIEDLGSANGTHVRGERLVAGKPVPIQIGEAIFIGATIALIQPASVASRVARLLPAEDGRARLAEACARGAAGAGTFAVVVIEVLDGFASERVTELAAQHLEAGSLLAGVDRTQCVALIPDGSPLFERGLASLQPAVVWGRADYPRDGVSPEELLGRARALANAACVRVPIARQLIFCDGRMRRLHELARRAAVGLVNVLILGETGVGKDVMAQAIHRASPRATKVFQRIECAALTEALAESELFGHERGAFTGALTSKAGLIEVADGGTVFLDEVGELPLRLQAKLLHVVETRQITRVGALRGRPVDVRFVAATNRNLEEDVAQGLFRKDLYYRLNGFSLSIPPLRDRPGEILPLARAMLRETIRQLDRDNVPDFAAESIPLLEAHPWPGNVRELRNVVERSALMCEGQLILPEHLPFADDERSPTTGPATDDPSPDSEERRRIEEALARCGGNQRRAAKLLGMARSTLVLRLDAFGITRPRKNGPG
jgi:two-component system response regulator AtoC